MEILKNADLSKWTTIKIGGICSYMAFPEKIEDIVYLINLSKDRDLPLFILGRGANTIFGNVKGIVINMLRLKKDPEIIRGKEGVEIKISAGNPLSDLINLAIEKNLGSIFKLYGFPATVGGAISMNAGAYKYEISEELTSIKFIDWEGKLQEAVKEDLRFSYRSSQFPHIGIILEARFFLKPSPLDVKREVKLIKERRKSTQPINNLTSGSTFKNPGGISAGVLLERCGFKGKREGNVKFSEKHANFLINMGGGKLEEVKKLIDEAKRVIFQEKGINLEEEVKIIEDSGTDGWKIL